MDLSLNQVTAILNTAADIRKIYKEENNKNKEFIELMDELSIALESLKKQLAVWACKSAKTLINLEVEGDEANLRYKAFCYAVNNKMNYEIVLSRLKEGSINANTILNQKYWWEQ